MIKKIKTNLLRSVVVTALLAAVAFLIMGKLHHSTAFLSGAFASYLNIFILALIVEKGTSAPGSKPWAFLGRIMVLQIPVMVAVMCALVMLFKSRLIGFCLGLSAGLLLSLVQMNLVAQPFIKAEKGAVPCR